MNGVFAEMDVAVSGRIWRQNWEDDLLVLITGDRTDKDHIGLIVAVFTEVDAFGFFLDVIRPAVLRCQGETIGKHHHGADLEGHFTAVGTDLGNGCVIRNLHDSFEHAVGQDRLGYLGLGEFLGKMAVGANDLSSGFPWRVVILLGPEGVSPTGVGGGQHGDAHDQGGE